MSVKEERQFFLPLTALLCEPLQKGHEITCFGMVDEQRACEMKWLIITQLIFP